MRGGETGKGMLVRRKLPLFCCSIQSSLSLLRKRQRNHALRRKVAFTKPIGGTKRGGDSLLFSDRERQCCVTFVLHWIPHGHFNASSRRMKGNVWRKKRRKKRDGFFLELFTSPKATLYLVQLLNLQARFATLSIHYCLVVSI